MVKTIVRAEDVGLPVGHTVAVVLDTAVSGHQVAVIVSKTRSDSNIAAPQDVAKEQVVDAALAVPTDIPTEDRHGARDVPEDTIEDHGAQDVLEAAEDHVAQDVPEATEDHVAQDVLEDIEDIADAEDNIAVAA